MYTALPHSEIRRAVTWVNTLFHQQTRRSRVNINVRGKADGRVGRVYDNYLRKEVKLEDIAEVNGARPAGSFL